MALELFTEGDPIADTKAPMDVPIGERWNERKFRGRLVNPTNRRKMTIIVVGTGLAERRGGRATGQAGADDDDRHLAAVGRVDQTSAETPGAPALGDVDVGRGLGVGDGLTDGEEFERHAWGIL